MNDDMYYASEFEMAMWQISRNLYRQRQAWACGIAPDGPWLNPYARRTDRMREVRDRRGYGLSQAMWQIEERADRWEHRRIMNTPFYDDGVYAEID